MIIEEKVGAGDGVGVGVGVMVGVTVEVAVGGTAVGVCVGAEVGVGVLVGSPGSPVEGAANSRQATLMSARARAPMVNRNVCRKLFAAQSQIVV